ncbi:MAG: glgA [Chthoniobacteraceae bacterium]|nr:glgA [Chthoniobacteraceae bacterium]
MKILFAGSELTPFARTGGLGDVLDALPAALAERGHEVSVVLPCYRGLREDPRLGVRTTGVQITVQVGAKRLDAEILQGEAPNGVQVFLVRRDEYFDRSGLYGFDGRDYGDNAERFIYFSKAVVELARRVLPPPQILHVHDWQAALVPALIKERALPFKTVLTIHNLAYQGSFWGLDFGLTNLPGDYFSEKGVEFYGNLNLLKGGIVFADQITTVSERYAREIQTPEYGCGLDPVLREKNGALSGILNGADAHIWNPETDTFIPAHFSSTDLSGKAVCKKALLTELNLDPDPRGPVIAMVSRLAEQKGIDLLLPIIDRLLSDDVRLVILGEGDTGYERELMIASKRHAGRFSFLKVLDERLAHLIEAGADIALVPSHFEPCGLSAMYSLKYGTLPVARATGGLFQIVRDYDPGTHSGTGFLFFDYQSEAFYDSILRAKQVFENSAEWQKLMERAMGSDFSWARAAESYEAVYERALKEEV